MVFMSKYLGLISIGLSSGIINAILAIHSPFKDFFFTFGAGISYGIVTGIYFIRTFSFTRKYLRLFAWVVVSGLSYFCGTSLYMYLGRFQDTGFVLGGLGGAIILTIAFHFIFKEMSASRHIVIVVIAGVIPFILTMVIPEPFKLSSSYQDHKVFFFWMLYIVWQTVITTLLGSSTLSREQKSV